MSSTENNIKSYWSIFDQEEVGLKPPVNFLSFGDLQLLPEFRLCLMRQDKDTFERILWENGLDVSSGYNVKKSHHRLRTSNSSYYGFRVEARERTDLAWKHSGACSMEAYCHTKDFSLTKELINLDPRAARYNRDTFDEASLNVTDAGEDCV